MNLVTIQAVLTSDNHLDPSAISFGSARLERKKDHLRCFEEVIEYAKKNKPDIFLISGDLFDIIRPGNWIRARLMQHFRDLYDAGIKTFMVSGHHDTPKSIEEGVSPLAVYGNSGNVVYFENPASPTFYTLEVDNRPIHVFGIGYNPFLSPMEDPVSKVLLKPPEGINILLTHYPIEGFSGYTGEEASIRLSSIPDSFNLVAAGHFHSHQVKAVGRMEIVYTGSTERASFAEEGEDKGFVWAEIKEDGGVYFDFVKTSARPFKTLRLDFPQEGDPIELLKKKVSDLVDQQLVLRVRLGGKVTVERLGTYRRPQLLSFAQGKFFHFSIEEEFDIEAPQPIEALPRTTPLAELRRYFDKLMSVADEDERRILEEALRLSQAKLEEAGAW